MRQKPLAPGWDMAGGVAWTVEDGLLSLSMDVDRVTAVVDELRRAARGLLSDEAPTAGHFDSVHRSSRICWELLERGTASSLDAGDCEVLYGVRQLESVEWVFLILNRVRGRLARAGTTPETGDRYAKSVSTVMQS